MDIAKIETTVSKDKILQQSLSILCDQRYTGQDTTDLRRLRYSIRDTYGISYRDADFNAAWAKLQALGLGVVLRPKKHMDPARFKWKVNRSILVNDLKKVVPAPPKPIDEWRQLRREEAKPPVVATPTPGMASLNYPLRGGMVSFELPKDVTKAELKGLTDYIMLFAKS